VGTFVTKYAGFYDGMWAKLGEKYGKTAVLAAHEEAWSLSNTNSQIEGDEATALGSLFASGSKHEQVIHNRQTHATEEQGTVLPALAWVDGASALHGIPTPEHDKRIGVVAALRASAAQHEDARPVRSPVVVARVRAHQRRAADLYQDQENEGPRQEEDCSVIDGNGNSSIGGLLDNGDSSSSRRPSSGAFVAGGLTQPLDEFEAYDLLGPSVSRPTTSSATSDLSVASGHWPNPAAAAAPAAGSASSSSSTLHTPPLYPLPHASGTATGSKDAPQLPPSEPLMRSTPHSARSLPAIVATPPNQHTSSTSPSATSSSAKRSSRRGGAEWSAEKEAAAAQAWGLANPAVARAAVAREEALNRGQRDAAQRAKESDPSYRYQKLMNAMAHSTVVAAAAAAGNGGNGGGGGGAVERQRRKRAAAAAAEANSGSGAAWGAAGTSVLRDRARHQQRANAKKRLPAWATMPPIDPK